MKPSGKGAVLPAGSIPPVASLSGKVTITIEAAPGENDGLLDEKGQPAKSEHLNARCIYPDGFVKNHQTNSPTDLIGKVLGQLRARYGVSECKVTKLPKAVEAGATIELEV